MSHKKGQVSLADELMRALSPSINAPPMINMIPPEGTVFGDDPEEELEMINKIGEGSFGSVYRALHIPSQSYVAVKKVDLEGEDDAMKEGSTMEKLTHQNIVRFYAYYKFVLFSFFLSLFPPLVLSLLFFLLPLCCRTP